LTTLFSFPLEANLTDKVPSNKLRTALEMSICRIFSMKCFKQWLVDSTACL